VKHKSTPTITVELGGGLGNQIFGFIAGLYAEALTGFGLEFDFRQVSYSHNSKSLIYAPLTYPICTLTESTRKQSYLEM